MGCFEARTKGKRRQSYPETRIKPTAPSHIWPRKTLLLQKQEEKLSPSVYKVKVRQYREK